MADCIADSKKELNHNVNDSKSQPKQCLVASIRKHYPQVVLKHIVNVDEDIFGMGTAAKVGFFLLKLATLEAVRRFSKARCPFLWNGLQAMQLVCLPPFKWIQKWGVLRGFSKFMKELTRPILLLSVATTFSDRSAPSQDNSGTDTNPGADAQSDLQNNVGSTDSRSDGVIQSRAPEKWLSQLFAELEKDGMVLPERISEDELRRFYDAANGDFSCFLASVKKTILWRQNFRFLSVQELEDWSEVVFWHGRDVKGHPCLFVRIAPACCNSLTDRFCLPDVVVSQIEHGILNLVRAEDPLVTVLMDCEGLTPFRFPLQMMRSCAILLQDHYPNRLAALLVVRLPPIARVIAQTLFQVLRPGTRRKLQIIGQDYQKVLTEQLETLPSFLGGVCLCPKCSKLTGEGNNADLPCEREVGIVLSPLSSHCTGDFELVKWRKALKSIVLGLLLLLLCIVFSAQVRHLGDLRSFSRDV